MTLIASCGHSVNDIDDLVDLQFKGIDASGKRCISYGCFCQECADQYDLSGKVIHNKEEENEWLSCCGQSELYSSEVIEYAKNFLSHSDPEVIKFANFVIEKYGVTSNKTVTVRIDTANEFTLAMGSSSVITGVGKLIFDDIPSAIGALNGAVITWVKPFNVHTPDGIYAVSETDTEQYEFFVNYCRSAAIVLSEGGTKFTKISTPFSICVEVG